MMDEREFEQRARSCTLRLFRICCTILPEAADRDDAIQEALIKAWQRRASLKNEALFEAWLMRITVNECKNVLRRKKRTATLELVENIPSPNDAIPDPTLHIALQAMDLKLRLPLVLHYLEGYTIPETAELLRLPLGTLKHRLKKARQKLKDVLAGEE